VKSEKNNVFVCVLLDQFQPVCNVSNALS